MTLSPPRLARSGGYLCSPRWCRGGVAEAERPVILFSAGKDSTVLAHVARKAFHPAPPPLPLLHIDSTWEFQDLLAFRDAFAASYGFQLIIESNEDGRAQGLWTLFNWRRAPGQTIRAFRLSNWTERDLWEYIVAESIPLAPLYFASKRNVIEHEDVLIVLDEPERLRWPGKSPRCEKVRFRTLGCWPVTGAIPSTAETSAGILADLSSARTSERTGRVSDRGSLEGQKRDGYF